MDSKSGPNSVHTDPSDHHEAPYEVANSAMAAGSGAGSRPSVSSTPTVATGNGRVSTGSSDFVRKLHKMLDHPPNTDIVRWGNFGDSFVILENERFTKHILPEYFKHRNFASFVRQLNKYGFHKVRYSQEEGGLSAYGPGAWEFKHPDFRINNKNSVDIIRRKAPTNRKLPRSPDDVLNPAHRFEMINSQLSSTQQQLQKLTKLYEELRMQHSVLMQGLVNVQKTVFNHGHVIQNAIGFLHSLESERKRDDRPLGTCPSEPLSPSVGTDAFPPSVPSNLSSNVPPEVPVPNGSAPLQNPVPSGSLEDQGSNLLGEDKIDSLLGLGNIESSNDGSHQIIRQYNNPAEIDITTLPATNAPPSPEEPDSGMRFGIPGGSLEEAPVQTSDILPTCSSLPANSVPFVMSSKSIEPLEPRTSTPVPRKTPTLADPGWIRRPSILLVEDDPTCRQIGSKFLYYFNCATDSAFDGVEAVNKLHAGQKFDLVLMDSVMPNLDGVSASHLIRQFDSTPIIAMTSNIRSDDIKLYYQNGMNDVLPKPLTKESLLQMLEKHLMHLKRRVNDISQPFHPQVSIHLGLSAVAPVVKGQLLQSSVKPTVTIDFPNLTPATSPPCTLNQEEVTIPGAIAASFYMQPSSSGIGYPGPENLQVREGDHGRRSISDVSEDDENLPSPKRQQIFPVDMGHSIAHRQS